MKNGYSPTVSQIDTTSQLREGTSIEEVMRQNTVNKVEPTPILPELYQQRNEGIDPLCDIRTDRFDVALDAIDKITRAHLLAHQNRDKMGKADNTWITDEEGNPMYENPQQTEE